ncbi:MAG: type IV pilus modification PilV family protein [Actinomycetota bacterium]
MNGRYRRRGFSMIEVVIAIALLGVGIAACVACIGSASHASGRAEELTAVQLLAREKLAELELRGAREGEDQGDFGASRPGYAWRTTVSPPDVPGLSQVRLQLLWGNPAQPQRAEYVTYVRESRQ